MEAREERINIALANMLLPGGSNVINVQSLNPGSSVHSHHYVFKATLAAPCANNNVAKIGAGKLHPKGPVIVKPKAPPPVKAVKKAWVYV